MIEPPCSKSSTGRPLTKLLDIYSNHASSSSCDYDTLADGVYVSKLQELSLHEYSLSLSLSGDSIAIFIKCDRLESLKWFRK